MSEVSMHADRRLSLPSLLPTPDCPSLQISASSVADIATSDVPFPAQLLLASNAGPGQPSSPPSRPECAHVCYTCPESTSNLIARAEHKALARWRARQPV